MSAAVAPSPLAGFARFLQRHPEAGVIDIVVDTTDHNGARVPVVATGAYRLGDGVSLAESARMAYENEDDGFLYDELELLDDADDIIVVGFYPRWPNSTAEGDAALMTALRGLVPAHTDGAVRRTYLFHHVDRQPYINLLTGKPFAVRG
ncbi:hypothetical protein [Marilutibacter alkalisoli]|uniref:Uncharacterized protein n=1 Tax=Marilutibacter alkalisoli TaxID=2591633 RepID=A0A514BV07_9GAMM|nr:hypothetical protein [Lysobacter alkalisoli]QDH71145.1 hypothetical protein FKV23_14405 [Lysobacter alkalisoli]